jgi:hypothetical protein
LVKNTREKREGGKALGKLERDRMAHVEGRREVHLRNLLLHRGDDLRPAMAGVDAPETGLTVEDLASLGRPVMHAFGANQEPRRLLELPVRRVRHPERRLLQGGGEVGALVHAL